MKTTIQNVLMALIMIIPMLVMAQPNRSGDRPDREPRPERMERGPDAREANWMMLPDLTDDQKEQMKSVKLETKKQMLPIQNGIDEKLAQLKTAQTSEKVDMKRINTLIEEIGTMEIQQAKLRAQTHQNVRQLLDENQRVIFDSRFSEKGGQGPRKNGRDLN